MNQHQQTMRVYIMILLLEILDQGITRAFTLHKEGTTDYDITMQRIKQYVIMYINIEIKDIVDKLITLDYHTKDSRIRNRITQLSSEMTKKAANIDEINLCSTVEDLQEKLTGYTSLQKIELD